MTKDELKALVKQHFNLVEKTEKFDSATLEDGTKVTNDIDDKFAIGQDLFVIDGEGQKVAAPEGDHVTESGIVLTVDAEGKIADIKYPDVAGEGEGLADEEEKKEMEVEEDLAKFEKEEEAMEEEDKPEDKMMVEPSLEDIVEVISEVVEEKMAEHKEDMKKKFEEIEIKVEEIKEKMSAFAAEPADEKTVPSAKFSKQVSAYSDRRYNAMLTKLKNNI